MPDVEVLIEETLIESPSKDGKWVKGIAATCGNCELSVEHIGENIPTNREILMRKLRAQCPYKSDGNRYRQLQE